MNSRRRIHYKLEHLLRNIGKLASAPEMIVDE